MTDEASVLLIDRIPNRIHTLFHNTQCAWSVFYYLVLCEISKPLKSFDINFDNHTVTLYFSAHENQDNAFHLIKVFEQILSCFRNLHAWFRDIQIKFEKKLILLSNL